MPRQSLFSSPAGSAAGDPLRRESLEMRSMSARTIARIDKTVAPVLSVSSSLALGARLDASREKQIALATQKKATARLMTPLITRTITALTLLTQASNCDAITRSDLESLTGAVKEVREKGIEGVLMNLISLCDTITDRAFTAISERCEQYDAPFDDLASVLDLDLEESLGEAYKLFA